MAERYVTMAQLCSAVEKQRVRGMFGSGTACAICPIGKVIYQGKVIFHLKHREKSILLFHDLDLVFESIAKLHGLKKESAFNDVTKSTHSLTPSLPA